MLSFEHIPSSWFSLNVIISVHYKRNKEKLEKKTMAAKKKEKLVLDANVCLCYARVMTVFEGDSRTNQHPVPPSNIIIIICSAMVTSAQFVMFPMSRSTTKG